jgi:hypothetical protein
MRVNRAIFQPIRRCAASVLVYHALDAKNVGLIASWCPTTVAMLALGPGGQPKQEMTLGTR